MYNALADFSCVHAILTVIVEKELGYVLPLPETVGKTLAQKGPDVTDPSVLEPFERWLGLLDLAVTPSLLRSTVNEERADESTIQALIRFLVAKKAHSQADRDKVDWLTTHFLLAREEQTGVPTGWPRSEVEEILQGLDFPPLSQQVADLLMEIPSLLDEAKYLRNFSQITDSHIIQRGQDLKNQFGEGFFHPDVLTAIVNYNLLFGRKFHALLQEIMPKVHEFAQAQLESTPLDTDELLRRDYRSTAEAFRHLSELGRKQKEVGKVPGEPVAAPPPLAEKRPIDLLELGIDPGRQAERFRNRMKEIAMRLRANPGVTSIPNPWAPLPLSEWESSAFRTDLPDTEQSFRAEFARGVCQAITILACIHEEFPAYHQTKGTEYAWKQHYDALVYLLYEGRRLKEELLRLSAESQKRGLQDKSKQLLLTTEKLEASLAKVAALF